MTGVLQVQLYLLKRLVLKLSVPLARINQRSNNFLSVLYIQHFCTSKAGGVNSACPSSIAGRVVVVKAYFMMVTMSHGVS